ncbi:MAG: hypothetical protein QNJ51_15965 [Calothrix sp. MO_167.B12]|nr:hypothetical protein [Calothrix sp. MO_167.B12]
MRKNSRNDKNYKNILNSHKSLPMKLRKLVDAIAMSQSWVNKKGVGYGV